MKTLPILLLSYTPQIEKYNLLDFVNYYIVFNSTKITKEKWKYIATRRASEMYRNRNRIYHDVYKQVYKYLINVYLLLM